MPPAKRVRVANPLSERVVNPRARVAFPSELWCGITRYTVELAPQHRLEETGGRDGAVGATNRDRAAILIGDWLSPEQQRETLVHEMLHIAWGEGIPNGWATSMLSDENTNVEEFAVDGMDGPLTFMLLRNPGVLAWLTDL